MRGTPDWKDNITNDPRIIPADAGNTQGADSGKHDYQDHPRGCGEHINQTGLGTKMMGSSPRMRGTLAYVGVVSDVLGIIPADAGNTGEKTLTLCRPEDHPRGCGEHRRPVILVEYRVGSSPRMRGTRVEVTSQQTGERIIPADAGNT